MRIAALAVLVACGTDDVALTATPAHGDLFGHYDVTIAGDVGDVSSVTVGGRAAYDLRPTDGGVIATLQGAPAPGPTDIVVDGSKGHGRGTFTFDAPATGTPLSWLAFGASLTQGTQSIGVFPHSQLAGVSALVAHQAGVDLAIPLFADGILPGLQLSDFTPDCTTTKGEGDFVSALFSQLTDPVTGLIDLKRGRIDPALAPRDIAIGGSKVADITNGGSGTIGLLEHIVEEPTTTPPGAILDQIDVSQLDRVEMIDPDVGIVSDLLANDIDGAVVASDDLHVDAITPLLVIQPQITAVAQRLGALHGQYFIANLPHLTFIPNVPALRAQRIANGTDTAQSFDAKVAQIDALTDMYDDALVQAIAPFPNLHLVDFRGEVEGILTGGVTIDGELCTPAHFDGLFSLDDLHFTDTGYALYANVFIDAIDSALGLAIPHADVDAIHAADALAPSKLRAAGFTCVPSP